MKFTSLYAHFFTVPVDQIYRRRNEKNSSTDLSLNATELPLSDTAPLANAIIIDEKGISLLLDRLGVPTGDRKDLINVFQKVPQSKANDNGSQQSADSQPSNDDENDKQKTSDAHESPAENTDGGKEDAVSPATEESNNSSDSS